MNRLSPAAILYGVLATMALDVMSNIVLGMVLSTPSMDGAAPSDVLLEQARAIARSTGFMLSGIGLGTLSAAAGGFLAARRAQRAPLLNALAVGAIGIGIGIALTGRFNTPLRQFDYWYLYVIPGALAGAWLFIILARRKGAQ